MTKQQIKQLKKEITMSKNTAWGDKAYRETRSYGGSKAEAKQASIDASERYYEKVRNDQFSHVSGNLSEVEMAKGSGVSYNVYDDDD